ncbi:hypothetical protein AB4Z48_05600 [Cupriavidus sp. 2TAF22]|uniref:hypothetical protein n=1 Tax=unclassified Cupriavidus TaxID=2640874 RepID=UPI003F9177B4
MAIGGQTARRMAGSAKAMGLAWSGDVPAAMQQNGRYEIKEAYLADISVTAFSTSCKPIHFVTAIPKSFPHNALTQSVFCEGVPSPKQKGRAS